MPPSLRFGNDLEILGCDEELAMWQKLCARVSECYALGPWRLKIGASRQRLYRLGCFLDTQALVRPGGSWLSALQMVNVGSLLPFRYKSWVLLIPARELVAKHVMNGRRGLADTF